jgi:hypothetical protein
VNAQLTLNSSFEASNILSAWEQKSSERLEFELGQISRLSGHIATADESERLELLAGIAEEMAQMMTGSGRCSHEDAELYCGLLRHLSSEGPQPAFAAAGCGLPN